mgnify:FL=1
MNQPQRQRGRPRAQSLTCSIDGCNAPSVGVNLCRKHWQRQYRTGSVVAVKCPRRNQDTDRALILAEICERPRTIAHLALVIGAAASTVRPILQKLASDGLARSSLHPLDRRITLWAAPELTSSIILADVSRDA